MTFRGTQLANKVLDDTKLRRYFSRHFTQKRANDRTYKIWGHFSEEQAELLRKELNKAGVANARLAYHSMMWGGSKLVSGVRFELAE